MNLKEYLNTHRFIFAVLIFVVPAVFLSLHSCAQKEWCGQDIDQYKDYSDSLLAGKGYSASKVTNMYFVTPQPGVLYVQEILRLPAYSLVITLMRLVFDSPKVLAYSNLVFYFFTLTYTFLLGRKLLSPKAGYLALVIVGLSPSLLFYSAILPSVDVFTAFCLVGFLYHLMCIRSTNTKVSSIGHTVVTTIFALLAIFTRQNSFLIVLGMTAFLFILDYATDRKMLNSVRTKLCLYLIILICSVMSIILWSSRNQQVTGYFGMSFISGNQLFNEHIYFTPVPNQDSIAIYTQMVVQNGATKLVETQLALGRTIPQAYAWYNNYISNITMQHILKYPAKTTSHYGYAIKDFFYIYSFSVKTNFILRFYAFLYSIIIPLLVGGLCTFFFVFLFTRRKSEFFILAMVWFLVFVFCATSAFVHGAVVGNRGIIPVLPFLALICVGCTKMVGSQFTSRK